MPPSRRNELIDSAMRVFYKYGFQNTSLDTVLAESGISRMTLYNHFKSKDELILAVLRKRDEQFRDAMIQHAQSSGQDSAERILAVFDYHAKWQSADGFCGCMFINAAAEYCDPENPVRLLAAEHKRAITRYLCDQCVSAELNNPKVLAEQLSMLLDGATVAMQVVGMAHTNGITAQDTTAWARQAAQHLINASRSGEVSTA